jgi:hypothetical protein
MDHAVEHPLDVDFDPPPQGKAIKTLLRPNVPKDRFHNRQPLTVNLSGFGRIDFRDHLLGERRFGFLEQDGQMFAPRLGGL